MRRKFKCGSDGYYDITTPAVATIQECDQLTFPLKVLSADYDSCWDIVFEDVDQSPSNSGDDDNDDAASNTSRHSSSSEPPRSKETIDATKYRLAELLMKEILVRKDGNNGGVSSGVGFGFDVMRGLPETAEDEITLFSGSLRQSLFQDRKMCKCNKTGRCLKNYEKFAKNPAKFLPDLAANKFTWTFDKLLLADVVSAEDLDNEKLEQSDDVHSLPASSDTAAASAAALPTSHTDATPIRDAKLVDVIPQAWKEGRRYKQSFEDGFQGTLKVKVRLLNMQMKYVAEKRVKVLEELMELRRRKKRLQRCHGEKKRRWSSATGINPMSRGKRRRTGFSSPILQNDWCINAADDNETATGDYIGLSSEVGNYSGIDPERSSLKIPDTEFYFMDDGCGQEELLIALDKMKKKGEKNKVKDVLKEVDRDYDSGLTLVLHEGINLTLIRFDSYYLQKTFRDAERQAAVGSGLSADAYFEGIENYPDVQFPYRRPRRGDESSDDDGGVPVGVGRCTGG